LDSNCGALGGAGIARRGGWSARGDESGTAGGGRRGRKHRWGRGRGLGQGGSTVGPDQSTVLDALKDLSLGDDDTIERVHDNRGSGEVDVLNDGCGLTLQFLVVVASMMVVTRHSGGQTKDGRKNDERRLHVVDSEG
jgi:hypothetical protein